MSITVSAPPVGLPAVPVPPIPPLLQVGAPAEPVDPADQASAEAAAPALSNALGAATASTLQVKIAATEQAVRILCAAAAPADGGPGWWSHYTTRTKIGGFYRLTFGVQVAST